jgi:hypothetical protein
MPGVQCLNGLQKPVEPSCGMNHKIRRKTVKWGAIR